MFLQKDFAKCRKVSHPQLRGGHEAIALRLDPKADAANMLFRLQKLKKSLHPTAVRPAEVSPQSRFKLLHSQSEFSFAELTRPEGCAGMCRRVLILAPLWRNDRSYLQSADVIGRGA